MKELKSSGPWPRHAWEDMINIMVEMQNNDIKDNYVLVGPKKILGCLQQLFPSTGHAITYEKVLIKNNILKDVIMLNNINEDYVLIHGSETNYKSFPNIETKSQIIKLTDIDFLENKPINEISDEELHTELKRHLDEYRNQNFSSEYVLPVILEILERLIHSLSEKARKED